MPSDDVLNDATADLRALRQEDNRISDANYVRRTVAGQSANDSEAGHELLRQLGIPE